MIKEKYIINPWSIIEKGFLTSNILSSESVFSIGNELHGKCMFEHNIESQNELLALKEKHPDKTKVGWWKKGYPDYFAKNGQLP